MTKSLVPKSASDAALRAVQHWVKKNCGISFSKDQGPLFADRIRTVCRELKLTVEGLSAKLEARDHDTMLRVAEAASTNYTFFFREPDIFSYFTHTILPSFSHAREVRIWSAAASSGDEAYSIAIASHESLGDEALRRVRILGTDISQRQVHFAEAGVYPRDQTSLLDPARAARWLRVGSHGKAHVVPELKAMCTFRRLNLAQTPWPFEQRFHVIFLRNVLYYFEVPMRKRILDACFEAVEPAGYLITSLTEPMLDMTTRFHSVRPAIYRRRHT